MKNKQFSKKAALCLAVGLLIVSVTQVLSRYFTLPDYVHGGLMGLGIGVEWYAFLVLASGKKKTACNS